MLNTHCCFFRNHRCFARPEPEAPLGPLTPMALLGFQTHSRLQEQETYTLPAPMEFEMANIYLSRLLREPPVLRSPGTRGSIGLANTDGSFLGFRIPLATVPMAKKKVSTYMVLLGLGNKLSVVILQIKCRIPPVLRSPGTRGSIGITNTDGT
jgi:hypothetical protein